jgi:alkanesulfonate monooxygenase SsuD/methylene tetrahydromethanopterin reductase-like flavin-dependent oxidoreductase (luciferase family)
VKVFEDFATVDLLSGGRAEIIAGRGAFIESFALFGFDTDDYDELFPEKLNLLIKLNKSERVTWHGQFRSPLQDSQISPRPAQAELPIWIGVGGTPESVVRAGTLGLPMMLAIIGGSSDPFVPLVDLYRQVGTEAGHPLSGLQVGVSTHFHIAKTSQQALDEFFPYYSNYFGYLARERGRRWQVSRAEYEQAVKRPGGLFVGSPQQIIDKILYQHQLFGHSRFLGQLDIGGQPFEMVAESINLLANEVAPVIRRETAKTG